jgi:transcriptional regulator GlxA family with amidase domain
MTALTSPRRIDLLAFPDLQLLDIAGPLQVFASANEQARLRGLPQPYAARVIAAAPALAQQAALAPQAPRRARPAARPAQHAVISSAGLGLLVDPLPSAHLACDTLIVAGGWGVHAAARDPALIAWVRRRAAVSRRLASVCTGAFLLAAAGLLDDKRAVTHWTRCAELAQRYPAIRVEPDPIFIRDGALWTSAGVTAGIDLALALVEDDLGQGLALEVAQHLVVFLKRPGGQAQFSATLSLQKQGERFGALHAWIAENLAADLSLAALALRAGMSERTFVRHYRAQTGVTPARAIEQLRLEAARRLLADTALPVKRIAARCGFSCEETLRRSFQRNLGVAPQAYRERFAPPRPSP